MTDGFNTLIDELEDYEDDKIAAFDAQHALVQSYYDRAIVDEKNISDLFNAMNVHYLSGITIDTGANSATYTASSYDLTVYDDCFDHFDYDVAHLAQYAPGSYDYGNDYGNKGYGKSTHSNNYSQNNYNNNKSYSNNSYNHSNNYNSNSYGNNYNSGYKNGYGNNSYNSSYGNNSYGNNSYGKSNYNSSYNSGYNSGYNSSYNSGYNNHGYSSY